MVASYCGQLILLIAIMQLNIQLYGATTTFCVEQSLVVFPSFSCQYINVPLHPACVIVDNGAILVMVENKNDACNFDANILVQR